MVSYCRGPRPSRPSPGERSRSRLLDIESGGCPIWHPDHVVAPLGRTVARWLGMATEITTNWQRLAAIGARWGWIPVDYRGGENPDVQELPKESGARRIRTADLLGAIRRGRQLKRSSKSARLQGIVADRGCLLWRCCGRGYAGICGDMQEVGHSWREVPEIGAGRLEILKIVPRDEYSSVACRAGRGGRRRYEASRRRRGFRRGRRPLAAEDRKAAVAGRPGRRASGAQSAWLERGRRSVWTSRRIGTGLPSNVATLVVGRLGSRDGAALPVR
jgi:hypothetical protein